MATGLFGLSPSEVMQQRNEALQAQANQYAQLDPLQRAASGMYQAGARLGGAFGGMMGIEDPQLKKAKELQQLSTQFDLTTAEGLNEAARALASKGYNQEAMQLAQKAKASQLEEATLGVEKQKLAKGVMDAKQEAALRDELSKLGPNATQEDILGVVTKYGSPDKVLSALQASADRGAAREQQASLQTERLAAQKQAAADKIEAQKQMAQDRIDAQIAAAREAGATRKEIAQMQIEGRTALATLAASLKGPSAAELKLADSAAKAAEGKESLADTIQTAKKLVDTLGKSGGMSSTAAGGLANLVTKTQTSPAGQWLGQAFGTENQKNRDVLASTRLQLLNAVKQATGMSSTQLNSNMELQTWLNSLGSPGSTVQANQEILNNISRTYLKNAPAAGETKLGTKENPIVLK